MNKPLERKEYPISKGREYIRNHGHLKLICTKCSSEFMCSGHCIIGDYGGELRMNTCLCGNCDKAKDTNDGWYAKCGKEFPYSWIVECGKPNVEG